MQKKQFCKYLLASLSSVALVFSTFQVGNAANPITHEQGIESSPVEQRTISKDEAKSIALKQIKGRVIYVDLDTDNGITKYEVIILTDQNKVYEVEINANSGEVIKIEQEND